MRYIGYPEKWIQWYKVNWINLAANVALYVAVLSIVLKLLSY
jgi:hypothetical protein